MIATANPMKMLNDVGVVVIGRNEGARLRRCLESIVNQVKHIVYVDSGSNDNSVELAKEMGVSVVCLDLSKPFTAARARNIGYHELICQVPDVEYVQFVDGDCELNSEWLSKSREHLYINSHIAVVCGRLRERHPSKSIYRKKAFDDVNGINSIMIAGEEPEL